MLFYSETLNLQEKVFLLLRDLIHDRTGLFFDNDKRDILADKLSPLVMERGFTSFMDYYYLLKYDEGAAEEWKRVMDRLSVQETYFWREVDQIRSFVDVILPEYAAEHPGERIRIWSAACATGEEPLTIAMALEEASWFEKAQIEIFASDASTSAIERARAGLYRERSFRSLPAYLRLKYFVEKREGEWAISPEIHSRVTWGVANLVMEDEVAYPATSPVIFCRNVFIYFSDDSMRRAVNTFSGRMPPKGYLFVGASESLFKITSDFELNDIGGAFVYIKQKKPAAAPHF